MATEQTLRIQRDPEYRSLIKRRNALTWGLTIVASIAYYCFILVVAFDKALFAIPVASGFTTTWGMPAGFGLLLLNFIVVAVYVRKANRDYDEVIRGILAKESQL